MLNGVLSNVKFRIFFIKRLFKIGDFSKTRGKRKMKYGKKI